MEINFFGKAPKVSCPKCGNLHEINARSVCPKCGLKYKLPPKYSKFIEKARKKEEKISKIHFRSPSETPKRENNILAAREKSRKLRNNRLLKIAISVALFSIVFLIGMSVFFRDKDALLFKIDEYKNQPLFYLTDDNNLHCYFSNNKGCDIGAGTVSAYLSSTDGKRVYFTYSGKFGTNESNYVLLISKYGKEIKKIAECSNAVPEIIAGGNNKYLYILTPTNTEEKLYKLSLSVNSEKPIDIANEVREISVSTSGRYALISINDNGASKIMKYSATTQELSNPGIKNAHPLSIDNKGEYMIYAKSNSVDSSDIVVEKSTTERVEIPIFNDNTSLKKMTFSQDRRSFSLEYTDRILFYTCGEKDYTISNYVYGSDFSYSYNENVCYNFCTFKEIPQISNVYGTNLLPYYFYDKENECVYRIENGGVQEPVFGNNKISELRVSENGKTAFVSAEKLYTGSLDQKNNEICEIMNFSSKSLIDITPDGKLIYYTDKDGNMFTTEYGKKNTKLNKIAVDPDIVKYDNKSEKLLFVSDGKAKFIDKKGKTVNLCENILPEESVVCNPDLSQIFFVKEIQSGENETQKSLYLYSDGESKLVTSKLKNICLAKESLRIDRTKSYFTHAQTTDETAESPNIDTIPVQQPLTQTDNAPNTPA